MHVIISILRGVASRTWFSALVISVVLIGFFISLIDWPQVKPFFSEISGTYLVLALTVLSLEGVFTSLRIQCFTPGNQKLYECLRVNAWFVLMLIVLPGRIGEIAVVLLYRRYLHQKTGTALMNVISQRILDIIILSIIFLAAVVFMNLPDMDYYIYLILSLLIIVLVLVMFFLTRILESLSSLFLTVNRNRKRKSHLVKVCLKILLNARTWYKNHLTQKRLLISVFLSLLKWLCNIGGLVIALISLGVDIEFIRLIFLGASYNFLGIVPLQTIGGIGVSEVGLSGIMVATGSSLDQAAATSIYMRFVAIINPILFFLLVMLYISLLGKKSGSEAEAVV